ncbi:hypothetical protein O181_000993 [Austropuccinia psidii MF-1]|uniref:Uncharacterized protein n=1 Tax=Austropuccinia psidii MF-1 TaxID=1389203 RepID=A0A9Q3B9W5_9BASI|nr:hypothetical protein [Austropuccinia psidii MF-1]
MTILVDVSPGIWKVAQHFDRLTHDLWTAVVSLQVEKAEIGELVNALPDPDQLFKQGNLNYQPLSLTDTPIQLILQSLGSCLTFQVYQNHQPSNNPPQSISSIQDNLIAIKKLNSNSKIEENDSDIEINSNSSTLKWSIKIFNFYLPINQPINPSFKKQKISFNSIQLDHSHDSNSWISYFDGCETFKISLIITDLIIIILNHAVNLGLDPNQNLKHYFESAYIGLLKNITENSGNIQSLNFINCGLHALILRVKNSMRGIKKPKRAASFIPQQFVKF